MSEADNYAGRLVLQLETRGDVLSKEAADFIRAERVRVAYLKALVALHNPIKKAA